MTNKKSARDWAIFMDLNYDGYSDVERMTAIEHIAYAPTHNSITKAMMLDAIRYLLTAQQPRVLTLEEVTGDGECWIESKNGACGYCDCYLCEGREAVKVWRCMEQQPSYVPWFTYGKVWRCWTARPTDEQREATPWGEMPKEEENADGA